jgi:hypothetical protein
MGPSIDATCKGSMYSRKHHGARLRMGRGARRDGSFVIGRPLKIKPLWAGGRNPGSL